MKRFAKLLVLVPTFALAACYHAVVETGRPASSTVVNKPFQPSFVFGLVPPPAVNVAQECKSGVAKVETQHSFVEGLVAGITFGIFTPMTVTVTCASGSAALPAGRTLKIGASATPDAALQQTLEQAAELSRTTGEAVFVTR